MAFNINAHVILDGPKNIKAVSKKIQKELGGLTATIDLQVPKNVTSQINNFNKGINTLSKNMAGLKATSATVRTQLNTLTGSFVGANKSTAGLGKAQRSVQKDLKKTAQTISEARNEMREFGKDAALAIRRFGAFTVATGVVFGFTRAIQGATKAALDYEREIVKVVQVTGASATKINDLNKSIQNLSVSLGVDANKLAELSRIFAQTGQTIDQVRASIRAVARSTLAPSFGEMKNTAEGLIAALAQFNIQANKSENVLAGLNAVSKKFAVEAEDLVSVIRRAGGVFSQSAGQFTEPIDALNQLIGIFTAVRSTTRETADTIAVGLRTIFTRIQRRGTIEFLKQFNIQLVDAKGNFVGLFPAFQELSRGLNQIIKSGDALTLSAITEELGGIRQVGKLIPAITQFNKALQATKVAGEAAKKGLGQDVALALQPLGKQFELLQQRFNALIRDISQSSSFQNLAKVALSVANAFLSVAETLKPLIPLITTFATIKLTKGLVEFGRGFMGGLKKGGGAGGVGSTLGGGMSGGRARTARESSARVSSSQSALANALKSHSSIMGNNNTHLQKMSTELSRNSTAITNSVTQMGNLNNQMIGVLGNVINALNRVAAGGGGFGGRPPKKFAKGGHVRGPSHAQGGVPAILEGGEYVVPKKFAAGGPVDLKDGKVGMIALDPPGKELTTSKSVDLGKAGNPTKGTVMWSLIQDSNLGPPRGEQGAKVSVTKKMLEDHGASKHPTTSTTWAAEANRIAKSVGGFGSGDSREFSGTGASFPDEKAEFPRDVIQDLRDSLTKIYINQANTLAEQFAQILSTHNIPTSTKEVDASIISGIGVDEAIGKIFEASVSGLGASSGPAGSVTGAFDHPTGVGQALAQFSPFKPMESVATDAKKAAAQDMLTQVTKSKTKTHIAAHINKSNDWMNLISQYEDWVEDPTEKPSRLGPRVQQLAAGGNVFKARGTDTVPAMLTPGEFVINKKSAQSIGYGNLGKMNHLAKGGVASKGNIMQYFRTGTTTENYGFTDVKRGTGEIIQTVEQLQRVFDNMLGSLDQKAQRVMGIATSGGVMSTTEAETRRGTSAADIAKKKQTRRGAFYPDSKSVTATMGLGTESTVVHEAGHAADFQLGGGKKAASETKGTLQFEVIEKIKAKMAEDLKAAGERPERIKEYLTKNVELFAELFQKSTPAVRSILIGTTNAADGMAALANHVAEGEELYGDLHKHLPATYKPTGTSAPTTVPPQVKKAAATATATATAAAPAAAAGGGGDPPDPDWFEKLKAEYAKLVGEQSKISKSLEAAIKKQLAAEGAVTGAEGTIIPPLAKKYRAPGEKGVTRRGEASEGQWKELENAEKAVSALTEKFNKLEGAVEAAGNKLKKAEHRIPPSGGPSGGGGGRKPVDPELPKFDPTKVAAAEYAKQLSLGATELQAASAAINVVDQELQNTAEGLRYLQQREKEMAAAIDARAAELEAAGVDKMSAQGLATREVTAEFTGPVGGAAGTRGVIAREGLEAGSASIGRGVDTEALAAEAAKSANNMSKLSDALGSGMTAVGAWTAALAGMDFSSPMAAMSSMATLAMAVDQTKNTLSSLGDAFPSLKKSVLEMIGAQTASATATKASAAADVLDTTATTAGASAESAETAANVLATKSELAEAAANAKSAGGGLMQNFIDGGKEAFGEIGEGGKKMMKKASDFMGGKGGKFSQLIGKSKIGKLVGGAGGKGGMKAIGPALKAFGPKIAGLSKILGKVALGGGIGGAIAQLVVGPIADGMDELIRGKKTEIAPGVTGVRGGSAGGAAVAGGLTGAAKGAAVGAGIGAFIPVVGPVVGAIVGGAIGGIVGAINEGFAQAEFNAVDALQKSSEKLGKTFDMLSKLGDNVGTDALAKVNKDLETVIADTNKVIDASFNKRLAESATSFSSILMNAATPMNQLAQASNSVGEAFKSIGLKSVGNFIQTGGTGVGISAQEFMLADASVDGFWSGAANMFDKAFGAIPVIGNMLGSRDRTKSRATEGRGKLLGESIKLAASQIDPSTFEKLDEVLNQTVSRFAENLGALGDKDALTALAGMETVAPDLNELQSSQMINDSFKDLSGTLNQAGGATGKFGKELNKLIGNAIKVHMVKDVADQLEILEKSGDPSKATSLANAYGDLQDKLKSTSPSVQELENALSELEQEGKGTDELRQIIENRKAEAIEAAKAAATQQLVAMAARESRQALDALAAGLDQFGAQLGGTVDRLNIAMGELESEFAMATGRKTVQQDESFNPFENLAAATNEEISAGIGRLSSMAGSSEVGGTAFRDLGNIAEAQRDFPRLMRDTLSELQATGGVGGTALGGADTISNVKVMEAITNKLADRFGGEANIPPQLLTALEKSIESSADRQGGNLVFSMDALSKMFEADGDVLKILGEVSEKAATKLAEATNSLNALRNAALKTAAMQQEMMQHRVDGELAMMDKANSIRQRIDAALGKGADSFADIQDDLRTRLEVQAGGGAGRGFGGVDVLDPAALGQRLQELNQRRDATRERMGLQPGQIVTAGEQGAQQTTDAMIKNTDELAKLNQEINGTEAALKELANETRLLAAIESQLKDAQARAADSTNSAMSIMKSFQALKAGEMSPEDFNKNITAPIQAVEDMFGGKEISSAAATDTLDRLMSGDQLTKGMFNKKLREFAEKTGVDTTEPGAMTDLRNEFMQNLLRASGVQNAAEMDAAGLSGLADVLMGQLGEAMDARSEAEQLGDVMQQIGDVQIAAQQTMLDQQQAKMAATLDQAHAGFQKAAIDFQSAVALFAAMRGGVDEADMTRATADVSAAEAAKAGTEAQIKELEAIDPMDRTEEQHLALSGAKERLELEKQTLALAKERLNVLSQEKASADKQKKTDEDRKKQKEKEAGGAGTGKDQAKALQNAKDMRAKQVKELEAVSGEDEHFFERAMGRWGGVGGGEGKGLTGFGGQGMADTVLSRTSIDDIQAAEQLGGMFSLGDNWNLDNASTDQQNLMKQMMRQMGQQFGGEGLKGAELGKELEELYVEALEGNLEVHDLTKTVRDRLLKFAKDEAKALDKVKLDDQAVDAAIPEQAATNTAKAKQEAEAKYQADIDNLKPEGLEEAQAKAQADAALTTGAMLPPVPTAGTDAAALAKINEEIAQGTDDPEKLKELKSKRGELLTQQGIVPSAAATGNINQDAAMLIVGALDRCCEKTTNRLDAIITVLGGELSAIKDQDSAINAREATVSPVEKQESAGGNILDIAKKVSPVLGMVAENPMGLAGQGMDMVGALNERIQGAVQSLAGINFQDLASTISNPQQSLEGMIASVSGGNLSDIIAKMSPVLGMVAENPMGIAGLGMDMQEMLKERIQGAVAGDGEVSGSDPKQIAAATAVADAAMKKKEVQTTGQKSPSTGILGELQKLNDTSLKMLHCLCGDIYPELSEVKEQAASTAQATESAKAEMTKKTEEKPKVEEEGKLQSDVATYMKELSKEKSTADMLEKAFGGMEGLAEAKIPGDVQGMVDMAKEKGIDPQGLMNAFTQRLTNAVSSSSEEQTTAFVKAQTATAKKQSDEQKVEKVKDRKAQGGLGDIKLPTGPDAKTQAEKEADQKKRKEAAADMKAKGEDPLADIRKPKKTKEVKNLDASEFSIKNPADKLQTFRAAGMLSPDDKIRNAANMNDGPRQRREAVGRKVAAAQAKKAEEDKAKAENEAKKKVQKKTVGDAAAKQAVSGNISDAGKEQLMQLEKETANRIAEVDKAEADKIGALQSQAKKSATDKLTEQGVMGFDAAGDTDKVAEYKARFERIGKRHGRKPGADATSMRDATQQAWLEKAQKEAKQGDTSLMEAGQELGVPAFQQYQQEKLKEEQQKQMQQQAAQEQRIRAEADAQRMAINQGSEGQRASVIAQEGQRGQAQRMQREDKIREGGAAVGNIEALTEIMQGKELVENLNTAFQQGGDVVARKIAEAFKATTIDLNAKMGPVQVQLTGGQVLESMSQGIIGRMGDTIKSAVEGVVNSVTGDTKDPSTSNTTPQPVQHPSQVNNR